MPETATDLQGGDLTREGREKPAQPRTEWWLTAAFVGDAAALGKRLSTERSAPNGLADGSDQVGCNSMRYDHKTLALGDFYGSQIRENPLGLIQMFATSRTDQMKGEALSPSPDVLPDMPFGQLARHSRNT